MTPLLFSWLFLPIGCIAAWTLLAPAALAVPTRSAATIGLLTTLLFSFLTSLLMIRLNTHSDALTAPRLLAATLAMLASGVIAAPLLDRARPAGIILGAGIVGVLLVPLILHGLIAKLPHVSGIAVLYTLLIAASIIGLRASKILGLHTARFTETGVRRVAHTQARSLPLGWLFLSFLFTALAYFMTAPDMQLPLPPLLVSTVTAALSSLLLTRTRDAAQKASEAIAAALLLTMGVSTSLDVALFYGLLATGCVLRSEAIAHALTLDDPQNFTGAILLPASLGLLLPGVIDSSLLTAYALWFYAALGIGLLMAAIVWPCVKFTVGLADPRLTSR